LGGSIATAGGLVFIGATNDARFRAFGSKAGKVRCFGGPESARIEMGPLCNGQSGLNPTLVPCLGRRVVLQPGKGANGSLE